MSCRKWKQLEGTPKYPLHLHIYLPATYTPPPLVDVDELFMFLPKINPSHDINLPHDILSTVSNILSLLDHSPVSTNTHYEKNKNKQKKNFFWACIPFHLPAPPFVSFTAKLLNWVMYASYLQFLYSQSLLNRLHVWAFTILLLEAQKVLLLRSPMPSKLLKIHWSVVSPLSNLIYLPFFLINTVIKGIKWNNLSFISIKKLEAQALTLVTELLSGQWGKFFPDL